MKSGERRLTRSKQLEMSSGKTDLLGVRVRDRISGMEGVVVSVARHYTGCDRIGVRPVERADRGDEEWFFPQQIKVTEQKTYFTEMKEDEEVVTEIGGFELGNRVEDQLTETRGLVLTVTYNLFNCPRVAIQPLDNTDSIEVPDTFWFDAPRATFLDEGASKQAKSMQENVESATGPSTTDVQRKPNRQ